MSATPTNEPTNGPTNDGTDQPTNAPETNTMNQDDPTSDAFSDPTADPTGTSPAGSPISATPYRVEPAAPVPDDAVAATRELPHLPPPTASWPDPSWPAPAVAPSPPSPPLVTVRKGPRPGAVMLGLLTMLVAAYALVANLTDADLSFRLVGPPMIGAFGGMLLVVGLAGVLAGRLRR